LRRVARPGALLVVVSDFHDWDENCSVQLRLLARHMELHGLRVHDPMEESLPQAGMALFSDGVLQLLADTGSNALRDGFERRSREHREGLELAFRSSGARLTPLVTGSSAAEVLGRCYTRRRGA
jgi:hypothetical protein